MAVLNRLWEHWYAFQGKTKTKHSVKWLADRVGVSIPTLRRYLDNSSRSYDPEVIERLCDVLDIPIEDFFYRSDGALAESQHVVSGETGPGTR